jgi:hypothetical protein
MKRRVLVLGLATLALAAATVSAAVMPGIPLFRPAAPAWTPVSVQPFELPAGATVEAQTSFAITSQTQYLAFQRSAGGSGYPYVDFERQVLIVTSLGQQDFGNRVTIAGATTDGSRISVQLSQMVDNPSHCRPAPQLHQVGQMAVISKPASLDASQPGALGFQTSTYVMPYSMYYQCGCPEMGPRPAFE